MTISRAINEIRQHALHGLALWHLLTGQRGKAKACAVASWQLHLAHDPQDFAELCSGCGQPDILLVYRFHSRARGMQLWGVACETCGWELYVPAWWPAGEQRVAELVAL